MQINLKEQWVAALRSGKYKKIKGHLYDGPWDSPASPEEGSFCVMGVLCHVSGKRWSKSADQATEPIVSTLVPPDPKKPHAKRISEARDIEDKLISKNDNTGMSFPELADWIEENL